MAGTAVISIDPSKDNTLYQYVAAHGDRSNALGFYFVAGETAMAELRRSVLAFYIGGSVPAGSTIAAVSLSMNMPMTAFGTAYSILSACLRHLYRECLQARHGESVRRGLGSVTCQA